MGSDGWLGFPPGRHFVVLPARTRRAAREGLALYDAVARRQQAYLAAGRLLLAARLGGLLALRRPAPLPDAAWWASWVEEAAVPVVGPVATWAFRLLGEPAAEPERVTTLLFAASGRPLAFGKVWRAGPEPPAGVLADLGDDPPAEFSVPRLLGAGRHAERSYLLQEPLPPGGHRQFGTDSSRLRAVIAELQQRLEPLVPSAGPGLVPVHGSLTPLNLRRDRAGRVWLLDWDKVGRGPRRYDELRYWIGHAARRGLGPGRRRAAAVLRRLEGPEDELRTALQWRARIRPREVLPAEQAIRHALEELLA